MGIHIKNKKIFPKCLEIKDSFFSEYEWNDEEKYEEFIEKSINLINYEFLLLYNERINANYLLETDSILKKSSDFSSNENYCRTRFDVRYSNVLIKNSNDKQEIICLDSEASVDKRLTIMKKGFELEREIRINEFLLDIKDAKKEFETICNLIKNNDCLYSILFRDNLSERKEELDFLDFVKFDLKQFLKIRKGILILKK